MSMLPFVLAVPPRAPAFLGAPLSSWEAQRRLVSDDVRARAEAHNGSYPVLNLTNASAPRVLGVTELSCEQPATLHDTFARIERACAKNPNFRVSINLFDATELGSVVRTQANGTVLLRCSRSKAAPAVAAPSCAVADLFSTVEGMKGLFWRREITPAAVADFDLVWLFDNDIAVDEVDLAAVAQTMQRAGVPLLQPRIAYPSGQLHQFHHLQPKPAPPIPDGCTAVSTTYIEVQTPIMAAAAWALYHEHVLQRVPEAVLNVTDWGIADNWCRFLHRAYIAEAPGGGDGGAAPPPCDMASYAAKPACAVASAVVRNFDSKVVLQKGRLASVNDAGAWPVYEELLPGCSWTWSYEWGFRQRPHGFLPLARHAASASLLQPQWSALQRDQPNDFSRHLKRLSPLWRPAERHEVDWEGGATARCLSYRNASG